MASLTQTAQNARKLAVGVLIFAVLILGFDILSRFLQRAAEDFTAPVEPWLPPDELYGIIELPDIGSLSISSESNPEYLVSGNFPSGNDAPSSALVYPQSVRRLTLNTEDTAEQTANRLGFLDTGTEVANSNSKIQLKWSRNSATRTLDFLLEPEKETWRMRTQYIFDDTARATKDVRTEENFYSGKASGILGAISLTEDTLVNGVTEATFAVLKQDGFFTEPVDPSTAEYVDMQIYHKLKIAQPLDNSQLSNAQRQDPPEEMFSKVYKLDPEKGSVSMVVSNEAVDLTRDLFSLDMIRFNYDSAPGVYPVISPQEAWQLVRSGEGYLRLLKPRTADRFAEDEVLNVTKFTVSAPLTELAYYEADELTGYVYPIYVFRGVAETTGGRDANFVFYVDAVETL